MGLSYGFYDNVDGKPAYNANDINQILSGIIYDGVYEVANINGSINNNKKLFTEKRSEFIIAVLPGKARFNEIWLVNDSDLLFSINNASSGKYRIDLIYIEINKSKSIRNGYIKHIEGEEANSQESAVRPSLVNEKDIFYYPISEILVSDSNTKINVLVGTEECPYVKNILSIPEIKTANNLTTTEPGSALDARQGKVLGDRVPIYFGIDINGKYGYKITESSNIIPF